MERPCNHIWSVRYIDGIKSMAFVQCGKCCVQYDLTEIERLRDALEAMRKLLGLHHAHHLQEGTIGLPDGEGGWVEIDNAAEYADSILYEQTREALADA